jgi:hypothetical protein
MLASTSCDVKGVSLSVPTLYSEVMQLLAIRLRTCYMPRLTRGSQFQVNILAQKIERLSGTFLAEVDLVMGNLVDLNG